jgi:hypothetical protein
VILVYAAGAIVAGILAATSLRAIRSAVRYARVARELEHIHRAAYRERLGAPDRMRCG